MTIGAALDWGSQELLNHSTSPELDSRVLLAQAAALSQTDLIASAKTPLRPLAEKKFRELLAQRKAGSPIAYLTGHQEFFGLDLNVTPDVLVPRPATELLVEAVLKQLPKDATEVIADVGTGSGAITLSLAKKRPKAKIVASDISAAALAIAKGNATKHNLVDGITWLHGSLLEPHSMLPRVDVVVANLPYLTPEQMSEPSIAKEPKLALDGGYQGLDLIWQLIDQLPQIDPFLGVALELDPSQVELVATQLAAHWPNHKLTIIDDGQSARGVILWRV